MEKELGDCEYPFVWEPRSNLQSISSNMVYRLDDRIRESEVDYSEFPFMYLMLYIIQSYELVLEKKIDEALICLESAEYKYASKCKVSSDNELSCLHRAFQHVIMAMKAHLLIEKGDNQAAHQVMSEMPKKVELNEDTDAKAALYGLRAIFFGNYGHYGDKKAVYYIDNAIELNPRHELLSLLHFLKGCYMSKIRHTTCHEDEPSPEEIFHYEEAVKLKKFNFYAVFLGEFYREYGKRHYFKTGKSMDELAEKSRDFYRESAKMAEVERNSYKIFKCAKGFLLLPLEFRDVKEAKRFLDMGLEISPTSEFGNHIMALYYLKEKDYLKAIHHLKIATEKKSYSPTVDLFRLQYKYRMKLGTNVDDLLEKWENTLENYSAKPFKIQVLSELVSYHLFISQDIREVCKYTAKAIELTDPDDPTLKLRTHRNMFVRKWSFLPFKLYDLVADEIKILLSNEKCAEEDQEYYKKLLKDLSSKGISVCDADPPQYLKQKYLKECGPSTARTPRERRNPSPVTNWRKSSKGPVKALVGKAPR